MEQQQQEGQQHRSTSRTGAPQNCQLLLAATGATVAAVYSAMHLLRMRDRTRPSHPCELHGESGCESDCAFGSGEQRHQEQRRERNPQPGSMTGAIV